MRNCTNTTLKLLICTLSFAALACVAACGEDDAPMEPVIDPPVSTAHKRVVLMKDNIFTPADVTIDWGDTVLWFNAASTVHTSTSGEDCTRSGLWDSGNMASGETFFVVFDSTGVDTTGTIPYYCIPHCIVRMTGTLTILQ